jgi:hypothetical protein
VVDDTATHLKVIFVNFVGDTCNGRAPCVFDLVASSSTRFSCCGISCRTVPTAKL